MSNLTIINPAEFFLFGNVGVTREHGFKLQKRLFHNNRLSNIFTNRAVDCWNSLPNEIVNAESFNSFTRKIKQLDLSEFLIGMSLVMKPCPGIPFQHLTFFHVSLKHQSIHQCLILLFILFIGLAFVKFQINK